MPRRKLERSHPWPLHPTPVENKIPTLVELKSNESNNEVDGSGFRKAPDGSARLTVANQLSRTTALQDDSLQTNVKDPKQNRSLEALFQAADSELQNYSTGNVEPLPPAKLFSGNGFAVGARVRDIFNLTSSMHAQTGLTDVPMAASFPLLRLNFNPDSQMTLCSVSSSPPQEVVCVKVINTNPGGQSMSTVLPETNTGLQTIGILSGHSMQQLQSAASNLEKSSCGSKPGKHVCPYCSRFCAKPSVLQKHIRTHTGERPYPCGECGFRFKTKSNLYKHCKSRLHLTKSGSESQGLDCLSVAGACEDQLLSEEMEDQDDFSPENSLEMAAESDEEATRQESQRAIMQLSDLRSKHFSSDSLQIKSPESDLQNFSVTSRSLSVPESSEDKKSVGVHSLLRLSDGSLYLMEKMSNGHAMLRPVLQEVANPSAISIPQSVAMSRSRPTEVVGFSGLGTVPVNVVTHERNSEKEQRLPAFETGNAKNDVRRVTPLPESGTVELAQLLQKLSSVNSAAALANSNADLNSFPALRLGDESVRLMDKANHSSRALLRPILQEDVTHPRLISSGVVNSTSPSFSKRNEFAVDSNAASIQLKSGVGSVQSFKEHQNQSPEKPMIQFESQPITSVANKSRQPKFLQKSSSANVSTRLSPNPNIMTSHRSLSVPGSHNISIAPKMAPIDPKNATPKAVQERIAMLISQNASIIDTPMADAPRPKRVLRHNSELATAPVLKLDSNSALVAKPLQRAKSLTPIASTPSTFPRSDQSLISMGHDVGLAASASPTPKKQKTEFKKSVDSLSKTASGFLLVPSEPNLPEPSLSLASVIGHLNTHPLSVNSSFSRVILPVKAKSLELSPMPQKETTASNNSSNISVGGITDGFSSRYKNEVVFETPIVNDWRQFPVSQDIRTNFRLPNAATVDLPKPPTRLDETMSSIQSIAKDVTERRHEFARTHLVLEDKGLDQGCKQMAPVTSLETHMDCVLRVNPVLPVQYVVIAANVDQSPTFVPMPTVSSLAPQISTAFETALQSRHVGESQLSLSENQEKTLERKHMEKSCAPAASSCSTFRSIPSICITPADSNPSTMASESWKMKLKGRLLMKRSLCVEKALSEERENRVLDANRLFASMPTNDSLWSMKSDSDVHQESGLIRSRSCDAAMPLKKRRKTLTELGRGTAFGTRIEDANEAQQSAESKSRGSSTRCQPEFLKDVSSSPGINVEVFHDQPENKVKPKQQITSRASATVSGNMTGSVPVLTAASSNGRISEQHLTSSSEARFSVINIPQAPASAFPVLMSDQYSIRPLQSSVPSPTVTLDVTEKVRTVQRTADEDELSFAKTVGSNQMLSGTEAKVPGSVTDRNSETGVPIVLDCSERNAEVAVRSEAGSVMLLLAHLYPSPSVSTNPTFCSIVKPQPTYVPQDANKKLSVCSDMQRSSPTKELTLPDLSVPDMLHLCHLSRTVVPHQYAVSNISEPKSGVLTHSSYWNFKKELEVKSDCQEGNGNADSHVEESNKCQPSDSDKTVKFSVEKSCPPADLVNASAAVKVVSCNVQGPLGAPGNSVVRKEARRIPICPGGYKSNEEYVYVRGRGKGKFVCELCGIRCKKPCMLIKHIRTHSDVRPHHCDVCSFGFKTKGNLSKHLKSKAHHLKCNDLGISRAHTVCATSGDFPVDGNRSLDLNVLSSSCDLHEEDMDDDGDDDDDDDEYRDFNDESKDDDDDENKEDTDDDDEDGDDVESLHADESEGLFRSVLVESTSASEVNKISESTVNQCCSFPDKVDIYQAVTDSEAAASLLDLSKGNQATEIDNTPSSNDDASHAISMTIDLSQSSFNPTLPYQLNIASNAISQERSDFADHTNANIPPKTPEFNPSVLLLTSHKNSSFQLPSPVFIAVSSASSLSSIPDSGNHPWIILSPTSFVQKTTDFGIQSSTQEVEQLPLDQGAKKSGTCDGECPPTVSNVLSSASSVFSPSTPCVAENVAALNRHRSHCEIVPVPGKVHGNVDECVNGKYVCGICRNSYHEPHQLTLHKNIHYLERPYRCSSCGVSFQNRALLERHQRSERHACRTNDPRPFKCDSCGVAFRIHGHLAKHLRSKLHVTRCESGDKVPADDGYDDRDGDDIEPDISFTQSESADGAMGLGGTSPVGVRLKTDDSENPLNESGRKIGSKETVVSTSTQFGSSSTLSLLSGVTIVTPSGQNVSLSEFQSQKQSIKDILLSAPLKCEMCAKTFTDVALFEKHINLHIELRPYICDICDAGFTSVRMLESHMQTHCKTKDHVCGACGDALLGNSPPRTESSVLSSVHCSLQNYEKVLPSAAVIQSGVTSSDTLVTCPLSSSSYSVGTGQLQPQLAHITGRNCSTVSGAAVSGHSDQLFRVIPLKNVLSLTDSNIPLMKRFGNMMLPKDGGNNIAFDFNSGKMLSGPVVHLIETGQKHSAAAATRPLSFLVGASSAGADAFCKSASSDAGVFCDTHQQMSFQVKGVDPMCRLLTVSFQVGENSLSNSLTSSNGVKDDVFVVPELLPQHVASIGSASNSDLPENILKSVSHTASL